MQLIIASLVTGLAAYFGIWRYVASKNARRPGETEEAHFARQVDPSSAAWLVAILGVFALVPIMWRVHRGPRGLVPAFAFALGFWLTNVATLGALHYGAVALDAASGHRRGADVASISP